MNGTIVNIKVINGLFSRVQIHRIGVYVNERVVRDFFRTCRKCEQFLLCKKTRRCFDHSRLVTAFLRSAV